MTRSIVGRLVAKDLYLQRWLIAGALLAGVLSLVLSGFSSGKNVHTGMNLGILLFMTTVIAFGVMVPMLGIYKERQDRSQLFVLSLPLSPAQYWRAKVWAALIAFLVPWLTLTVGVVLATAVSGRPQGEIPAFVAIMTFLLANCCLLIAVVAISQSEVWAIPAILLTNVSVTVFLGQLANLPGVADHRQGAVAVWSPEILTVLAIEGAAILLSLALALAIPSRKKDFV